MSESYLIQAIEVSANYFLYFAQKYGIVVSFFVMMGIFGLINATFSKVGLIFKYFFLLFVAVPMVIIVGLINKKERKKRKKDLGEIKAFLKENPERWKKIIYLLLFLICAILFIGLIYFLLYKFVFPFQELNELSKNLLENETYINDTFN